MNLYLFTLFCFVLIVQIYFVLRYFRPLLLFKPIPTNKQQSLAVSIVIAAKNEAKNLPQLISHLMNQSHPNYEVIIVNDRSTDNSFQILEAEVLKHQNFHVLNITELPPKWTGKKFALKKGIEAAKHDVILLTDADCIPKSDNWISLMTEQYDDKTQIILGFSPYQQMKGLLNQFIQFETLWTGIQYLSFALAGKPYMGVGRNLSYQKSIFNKDAFSKNSHIVGGDDDLLINNKANSENTKIVIDPNSHTLSIPKVTWAAYFIQKMRHLSVGTYYNKKDRTRLGLFALCNWLSWIMLLVLFFNGYNRILILSLFGFRSILFYTIFTQLGRKLGVRIRPFMLPLLDLFYNFFYLVIGLRALTAKKIKWS